MGAFSVAFRVMGPSLDPHEVTGLLGMLPTSAHRRGDPHHGKHGRVYAPFAEGLWSVEAKSDSTIEEPLRRILDELRQDGIDSLIDHGFSVDFIIGIFVRLYEPIDFDMSPDLLRELAVRRIKLTFAVYADECSDAVTTS